MPYRRLPNTDSARLRAMKIALEKGKELPPHKMSYSAKTVVRLQKLLPLFEHSIQLHRQSLASQNKRSKDFNEVQRKARVYMTHFVKVMNMAIYRGDLPVETRAYYGLATNESTVPSLKSENELISWGHRIIEGEEFRIRKGASPISNPTIAVVKVRFEKFLEIYNNQKGLAKKTLENGERVAGLRKEADEVILGIWNEVEAAHNSLPEDLRRKECEEYGMIYFFRKNELSKPVIPELQAIALPESFT